jgi:PAS domain S-box-containing protein
MNNFNTELEKLKEITSKLTENGYLIDRAEQWEFALDAIPDLVFIVNQNYKVKYINKALEDRLKVNKNDCIDKDCCNLFSDVDNNCLCRLNPTQDDMLDMDDSMDLGDIYIEKGLNGWFNFTRSSIFDDEGDLLGFICVLREVTDRIETTIALIKSEEKYRYVVKHAPTGIYEIDLINNKFVDVNDVMCMKSGYTKDELLNELTPTDLLTKESAKLFRERVQKISDGIEVPNHVEFKVKRKDGTTFWAVIHVKNIYEDGKIVGAHVVSHDIDERKRIEEALRKSEEKYRNLHQTAPLAFVGWDFGCNITEWNRNAERVFGWKKSEVIGKNLYDLIIADKSKEGFECIVKDLYSDRTENTVIENLTKFGKVIVCEWYNSVYHDCNNKPTGVISIVSDITEEKEKEKLIRGIFKASPSGIGLVRDKAIQWSNKKLREITGYTEEELNKQSSRMLYDSDEEHDRVINIKYESLLEKGYGYVKTTWRRKDGKSINVLLSFAAVDSDNISKGVIFTVTDVTSWNNH